jgi:hypothetical protein
MATQTTNPDEVLLDGILVRRSRLLGTVTLMFHAWAPIDGITASPYSTITHDKDRWWGRLGTERNLPAELEALPPRSQERWDRVHAWHEEQYQRAYQIIERAFPEAVDGHHSMGDVTLTLAE